MKLEGGRQRDTTQVKVLSPEIFNIAQGQGFHFLEASSVADAKVSSPRRAGVEVRGRQTNGVRWNLGEPRRSRKAADKLKKRGSSMAVRQSDRFIVGE